MVDSVAAYFEQQQLYLKLYIQPKASRDQLVGLHNGEIKVAITAPPVDGQANQHLIKVLAKLFKVPKSAIQIEKGELGRHKLVVITAPNQLPDLITQLLDSSMNPETQ